MSFICFRCKKPVYFAERRSSLGKEWHRQCLTCEECGKILSPGQHAEHRGLPYCNIPCYQLLYGPKISGYGIAMVSNNKFGPAENWKKTQRYESHEKRTLLDKILQYNSNVKKIDEACCKEINGRLVVEGLLRVHWRVNQTLRIAPFSRIYQSSRYDFVDDSVFLDDDLEDDQPSSMEVLLKSPTAFQPDYDTVTTVRISSDDATSVVIQTLLKKFRVNENPDSFGLFLLRKDGYERRLMPEEIPLLEHVSSEDSKFLLKEKSADERLTEAVKDFMTVSVHMLEQMLHSLTEKENTERLEIIERYSKLKNEICKYLFIVTETSI